MGSPRNMDIESGEIDFDGPEPATCNKCGAEIRRRIVNVRNHTSRSNFGADTKKTWFDTAIMCDCQSVRAERGATYEKNGYGPKAWVEES